MKAYNKKRKPKNTTKTVYRRRWIDAKWQMRSLFTRNKKYVRVHKRKFIVYSLIGFTKYW